MKKQIWHNPENVPASKVPKGWRFLKPHEVDGRFRGKCRIWLCTVESFDSDYWNGDSSEMTYIVQDKCVGAKQETLWAIRDPKGILHSTIRKTAKTAWGDFLAGTGASQKDMKNAGYRAVKVTVSYEVKE